MIVPRETPSAFAAFESNGVKIVPFEKRHALWILTHNPDGELAGPILESQMKASEYFEAQGTSFTGMIGNYPIAAGGCYEVQEGIGRAWVYVGDLGEKKLWFVSTARKLMFIVAEQMKLRRMEAHVLADFKDSVRWLKLLGFEVETPEGMKNFGPNNETFLLMARTFRYGH